MHADNYLTYEVYKINPCKKILELGDYHRRVGILITINVPLFKKMRDIVIFVWDYYFLSHFKGLFEGV